MKKLILTLCVAIAALTARGAEAGDTVAVITDASGVTVSRSDGAVTVDVARSASGSSYAYTVMGDTAMSDPWNFELPFLRKKHRRFATYFLRTAYIGFAIPANAPDGFRQSLDVGLPDILNFCWRPTVNTSFSIGAGMMSRKINLGGGYHFGTEGNVLTMEENTAEMYDVSSSLYRLSVSMPLRFQQRIYKGFGFGLAAIAKLNTYDSAETRWKSAGMSNKTTFTGLQQKPFTWDFEATVGEYNDWGVYVRYSPKQQFRKGFGPDFNVWSVGLLLYL